MSVAKTDTCTGHDLIAISAKCQKGEGIDTLNLLGIIHCLTRVFSEGRQIPHDMNSPTWMERSTVNPSLEWDVKLSFLVSLMTPLAPFLLETGCSLSQPFFAAGDVRYWLWVALLFHLIPALISDCAPCSETIGLELYSTPRKRKSTHLFRWWRRWWWFFLSFKANQ